MSLSEYKLPSLKDKLNELREEEIKKEKKIAGKVEVKSVKKRRLSK